MFVTRIEINGFKSFAEHTVIEFPKPAKGGKQGVTVIVGPNGSGKSNVADAIRWVLGEQSMKNLRGKKSEDIIFAGSEGKGKMSLATVTMVLDNTDKRADVPYEELSISRRLYRSGESEYLLNGNKVRLVDLQLLLARAQFGQGSYSVIGQGTIDRLLLQSPAERKEFFDEAVGIKEFQIKRHHAELKLARTEENIAHADAIVIEIEPRLKSLKRQVSKLEQRQEVEHSLRELQEAYYGSLYRALYEAIQNLQTELAQVGTQYASELEALQVVQTELARSAQEKSRTDIFESLQKELYEIQQLQHTREKDRAILQAKLETEYGKAGKQNVAWIESKLAELQLAEKNFESERGLHEAQVQALRTRLHERTAQLAERQREKIQLQQEVTRLEQSMRDIVRERDTFSYEGLRAVNAIVTQPTHTFGGRVYGILAELAQVDDTYRVALEVAATAHLTSLVVEDDRVAEACIQFLKQHHLGFATFLPLNTIRARFVSSEIESLAHRPGVYGLAAQLVSHDSLFDTIFSYVFGSTLVVENIAVAREIGIGKVRMVTLEGDIVETSGSMKGGFRHKRAQGITFATTAHQLPTFSIDDVTESVSRLREKLSLLEQEIELLKNEETQRSTELQIAQHAVSAIDERIREIAREISRLSGEQKMHTLSKDEYSLMMTEFLHSREVLEADIAVGEAQMQEIQHKIQAFNHEEEEKRARVFALQDEMQKRQESLNQVADRKHVLEMEMTKYTTHREDLEEEVYAELKVSATSLIEKGVPELKFTHDEAKAEIEKYKYTLSLIGGIDEEVLKEYQETSARYEHLRTQLADLKKASHDLYAIIEELDGIMKKKHATVFKKIKKEFSRYFEILFEGGKAELVELYGTSNAESEEESLLNASVTESGDELAQKSSRKNVSEVLSGIEVVATPPGKKIKNLAALSGGERTLTSIALLCAILHTNPSPFVLLDEVEAALDEANTLRFTTILQELAFQSQFIIITHNRVTMHAGDSMYGVTMGAGGISKLVGVTLEETEVQTS